MKIMIVDDSETNRKLLRVNLEGEGVDTMEAEDGEAALNRLRTEEADAVISDILMPRMDGYRLCQEIRNNEKLKNIPVIFYTSTYTSTGDEKLALDCGADRYIKKPAPVNVLMDTLRELVASKHPRPRPAGLEYEVQVMRQYNEALVRKLEERNAKLERARAEIMRVNAGLERRVEERMAELTAANQELEAFSHSIAHDLRSPLMAIDGFSHMLLAEGEGKLNAKAMDHLKFICKATRRMNELTSDLLRLARASRAEVKRERVDMSMLTRGIIHDMREAQPEREVKAFVQDGMIVNADMALLRIALENLLSNAWKFTANVDKAEVEVGVAMNGDGERNYFVKDNGAGFDMESSGRLFGAFERLHSTSDFPGTGIGLTTVQRIVKRHGGRIRGESESGKGATFIFDLGHQDLKEKR